MAGSYCKQFATKLLRGRLAGMGAEIGDLPCEGYNKMQVSKGLELREDREGLCSLQAPCLRALEEDT